MKKQEKNLGDYQLPRRLIPYAVEYKNVRGQHYPPLQKSINSQIDAGKRHLIRHLWPVALPARIHNYLLK